MTFLGTFGTYITQFLKNTFNVEGKAAATLNAVVSILIGVIVVFTTTAFTWSNLLPTIGYVFMLTTMAYNYLKGTPGLTST